MMQKNTWNKEAYLSGVPRGFRKKRFRFTAEAIGLLAGTTKDNVGNIIAKCLPYYNPLSRVCLNLAVMLRSADFGSCRPDSCNH